MFEVSSCVFIFNNCIVVLIVEVTCRWWDTRIQIVVVLTVINGLVIYSVVIAGTKSSVTRRFDIRHFVKVAQIVPSQFSHDSLCPHISPVDCDVGHGGSMWELNRTHAGYEGSLVIR